MSKRGLKKGQTNNTKGRPKKTVETVRLVRTIPVVHYEACQKEIDRITKTARVRTHRNPPGMQVKFNGSSGMAEISFNKKPIKAVRDKLKEVGFKWNRQDEMWERPDNGTTRRFIRSVLGYKIQKEEI